MKRLVNLTNKASIGSVNIPFFTIALNPLQIIVLYVVNDLQEKTIPQLPYAGKGCVVWERVYKAYTLCEIDYSQLLLCIRKGYEWQQDNLKRLKKEREEVSLQFEMTEEDLLDIENDYREEQAEQHQINQMIQADR
jgi:hypothetical protein